MHKFKAGDIVVKKTPSELVRYGILEKIIIRKHALGFTEDGVGKPESNVWLLRRFDGHPNDGTSAGEHKLEFICSGVSELVD